MSTPLVSVVIPVFNADRWVRAAVGSILAQSHRNIEIIAVDDGSSDRSLPMLEDLRARDSRLRIIAFAQNQGIVAALNEGVRQAQGEFIARMDADDLSSPQRIELQLQHLYRTGCDLCGTWVVEFGSGLRRTVKYSENSDELSTSLLFQSVICHPTLLAHRTVFERFQYRNQFECAEDYDFFARASQEFRLTNCPMPLLEYRISPYQLTNRRRHAMELAGNEVRRQLLESRGIQATSTELEAHCKVRSFYSINSVEELLKIENWLARLSRMRLKGHLSGVVASQWARACIRAAPLGLAAWTTYRRSELRRLYAPHALESLDILVLSALRLRHEGAAFRTLKRLGLSA
jgi:glycosyltransferase involved in cell wall biosynthesis